MITQSSAYSWTPHRYYNYALKPVAKKHWFWVPLPKNKNVKIFHSCDNQLTGQIPNFAQTIKKGTLVSAQDWSLAFTGMNLQMLSSVQNLKHEIPMHLKYIYSKGHILPILFFSNHLTTATVREEQANEILVRRWWLRETEWNLSHFWTSLTVTLKEKENLPSFPFFSLLSMLFQEDKANSSTLTQFWSCRNHFLLTLVPEFSALAFWHLHLFFFIFHSTTTAQTQRFCNFLYEEFWQVVQFFYSALTFPFIIHHPKPPTSEFLSTWNIRANYLQKKQNLSYIHLVNILFFLNSGKDINNFFWF